MSAFPASLSLESSGHCGIFPVMEGDVAICGEAPGVPEPGDETHKLCFWALVHCTLPPEEEDLLQCLQGAFKGEMTLGFHRASLLILSAWKGGCFGFPVSFFLLGIGAAKRKWLSALTLGSQGGWRYFRSLLRKHRTECSQLHSMIPSGLDKRWIVFKSCCWLRSIKVAIWSPFRPLLGRRLELLIKLLNWVAGHFNN